MQFLGHFCLQGKTYFKFKSVDAKVAKGERKVRKEVHEQVMGKHKDHALAWQAPTRVEPFRTSLAVGVATRFNRRCQNRNFHYRPRLCKYRKEI